MSEEELKAWREWAQFVYLGGGPISGTDDELRARVCAVHDAEIAVERGLWMEAALKKIRTWSALQSMHRAGDSVEMLAKEFGVPVRWVSFVMFPENDLDARYGRPSDRTKTAKADLQAALIELRDVKTERFRLLAQIDALESAGSTPRVAGRWARVSRSAPRKGFICE